MTPYIYPPHEDHHDPETIPAQRTDTTGNIAAVVHVDARQARIERLECIIHGLEGTLRAIRGRAQKGMLETSAARAAEQLQQIDTLAALALLGDSPNGANIEREALYDEP